MIAFQSTDEGGASSSARAQDRRHTNRDESGPAYDTLGRIVDPGRWRRGGGDGGHHDRRAGDLQLAQMRQRDLHRSSIRMLSMRRVDPNRAAPISESARPRLDLDKRARVHNRKVVDVALHRDPGRRASSITFGSRTDEGHAASSARAEDRRHADRDGDHLRPPLGPDRRLGRVRQTRTKGSKTSETTIRRGGDGGSRLANDGTSDLPSHKMTT